MSDLRYHFDPLERALHDYLEALEGVADHTRGMFAASSWSQGAADAATRLQLTAKRRDLFAASNEADLDFLLSEISERVRAGTHRVYVADEHCVEGGWYENHYSHDAWALLTGVGSLQQLYDAWRDVKRVIRAEELSLKARS